jgi:hypothetical protein
LPQSYNYFAISGPSATRFNRFTASQNRCFFVETSVNRYTKLLIFNKITQFFRETPPKATILRKTLDASRYFSTFAPQLK